MNDARTITIVGGGLAGLTLGIALRRRAVPVTIWEAGHYPRHRVCGEFISGRGRAQLNGLGLATLLTDAGAREARTTAFFTSKTAGAVRTLPEPALCVSRHALDAALARRFRDCGGELREGERWPGSMNHAGLVQATGRRVQAAANGWRWFGLKAHAHNVELAADLEMHLHPDGYVGLCRLDKGLINVCGLFRRHRTAELLPSRTEMLRGPVGSRLHQRLTNAVFVPDSVCAVGGLDLRPKLNSDSGDCRIGDAITMIPPFTGNGMSMAIESAELAAEPLECWSRGNCSWSETLQSVVTRCDETFRHRLAWANRLHKLMLIGPLQPAIVRRLSRSKWSWNFLFAHTR